MEPKLKFEGTSYLMNYVSVEISFNSQLTQYGYTHLKKKSVGYSHERRGFLRLGAHRKISAAGTKYLKNDLILTLE